MALNCSNHLVQSCFLVEDSVFIERLDEELGILINIATSYMMLIYNYKTLPSNVGDELYMGTSSRSRTHLKYSIGIVRIQYSSGILLFKVGFVLFCTYISIGKLVYWVYWFVFVLSLCWTLFCNLYAHLKSKFIVFFQN